MADRGRQQQRGGSSRGNTRQHDERNPPDEGSNRSTQRGRRGGQTNQQTDRLPWLKADHFVGDYGIEYDIAITDSVRLYTGGQYGDQIIVGVRHNDEEFDWSIRIGGQQFMRLEKRLGKNLMNWKDRIVPVTIESYEGKDYIAVKE